MIRNGKLVLINVMLGNEALIDLIYDFDLETDFLCFTDEDLLAKCSTSDMSVSHSDSESDME